MVYILYLIGSSYSGPPALLPSPLPPNTHMQSDAHTQWCSDAPSSVQGSALVVLRGLYGARDPAQDSCLQSLHSCPLDILSNF